MLIYNGDLYTVDGIVPDGAVLVDGSTIRAVGSYEAVLPLRPAGDDDSDDLNAQGGIIAAGFIDLQINGAGGTLISEQPEPETVEKIAALLPQFGCTAFLPTVITGSMEQTIAALRAVDTACGRPRRGARVMGAHVEGPFINPERKGVHCPQFIREPSVDELRRFIDDGSRHILVLTLAPEMPGADSVIAEAARRGITVSVGHSQASVEQVHKAVTWGARMVTHLFNAMPPLESRRPGIIGAALTMDALSVGLIADGIHVDPISMSVAIHGKRGDGMFLVTDAMPALGTDATQFWLNGRRIIVENGRCTTEDGTLAGSVLSMDQAVRVVHTTVGVNLADALRMAAGNAARAVRVDATKGTLEPGKDADVVVLDRSLNVVATVVEGETVYRTNCLRCQQ